MEPHPERHIIFIRRTEEPCGRVGVGGVWGYVGERGGGRDNLSGVFDNAVCFFEAKPLALQQQD